MYISRVQINRENRQKIKELSHVGAYHSWIENSFPDEIKQNVRTRKLWRIDVLSGFEYLLIVSETKPSIEELEKFSVPNTVIIKDYSQFLKKLEENKKYSFKVTLNPVISRMETSNQMRGRVMPHVTIEHQMKYFFDRSLKNGFLVNENSYHISERKYVYLGKSGMNKQRISQVTYEGILKITDLELFKRILIQGMGKKKAYGFGLMTVIDCI